ncbi:hypothetical protein [Streptococcus equi]|uniref:Uncharacterized protein n=1 Tax=Streptococcus equi subsp. zooepidemicus Sz4is TaxID=1381082 RepID=A0AAW3GPW4_STRSZ|nr:hypothetical protein AT55_01053 [Streptococcus equi subsp. zooepidemicus Sz4is]
MTKGVYKGSLLAQKILTEKLEKTMTKERMLREMSPRYRRLENVQLVGVVLVGLVFWYFFSLLLFTVVGVLLVKLHNHLPAVNAIPLDTPITILWLENWQINITLVAIGICCLCLSKTMTDKMEALKRQQMTSNSRRITSLGRRN